MNSINAIQIAVSVVVVFVFMSYSSIESVRGDGLFYAQIHNINAKVDEWYEKEFNLASASKTILGMATSDAHHQSKSNHWPRQLMRVLQVATGLASKDMIDMSKVNRIVAGLKHEDKSIQEEFQANYAFFLATKFKSDIKHLTGDLRHVSQSEFQKQTNALCMPYRHDTKGYYNFNGAINKLVDYAKVENVDDRRFFDRVVYTKDSIAPLYAAATICQIIDSMSYAGIISKEFRRLPPTLNSGEGNIDIWPYPSPQRLSIRLD